MSDDLAAHIKGLDIQELRLLGGAHILAEVLYDREVDEMVLKDPIEVGIGATGGRTFTEWFPFSGDQYFVIDKHNILASGSAAFDTKVLFCRLVIARNIRLAVLNHQPQSDEDLSLLKELTKMMGGLGMGDLETHDTDNDDDMPDLYSDWAEDVDVNKVH